MKAVLNSQAGSISFATRLGLAGTVATTALAACLFLTGCGLKTENLGSSREKLDAALASDKPVLVDFWKWGCASCWSVDPVMDKLAEEYRGRVVVARFMAAHFWFAPTDWEVYKRYNFPFFPTVILFVDGKEVHRWVWNTDVNAYRQELDKLVSPATQPDNAASK